MPIVKSPRAKEHLKLIRKRLPEGKVTHCVFAAEYISSFAPALGIDHDLAVDAALLHDICRMLEANEMLERAEYFGLPITDLHRKKPVLLHGPVAAEEIRNELGLDDPDLYEAVYWHTTGKPGLGSLALALIIADFAEPGRDYPESAHARELLRREGFGPALSYVAEARLTFNKRRTVSDPMAEEFLDWVRGKYGP